MLAFLGPILAAFALARSQPDKVLTGEVVDSNARPVADAQVVFYAPPLAWGRENSAESRTRTDAEGRFRLKIPPFGRVIVVGMSFLAYRPGLALSANSYFRFKGPLVLKEPEPRTIQIDDSEGKPIAGARITPGSSRFSMAPPPICLSHWPIHCQSRRGPTAEPRSITWRHGINLWPRGSRPTRSAPRISFWSIIRAGALSSQSSGSCSRRPAGSLVGSSMQPAIPSLIKRSRSGHGAKGIGSNRIPSSSQEVRRGPRQTVDSRPRITS